MEVTIDLGFLNNKMNQFIKNQSYFEFANCTLNKDEKDEVAI